MNFSRGKSIMTILIVSLNFQAHASLSKISGFALENCNEEQKCVKLKTDEVQSGTMTQLMSFQEFTLEIKEKTKTRTLLGSYGYYDPQDQRLVLTLENKKELELSLKDLSETQYN